MRFKRKIELGCVFDSVKKLPADVVRQNITNAGGPEASGYLLDLCAPLSLLGNVVISKNFLRTHRIMVMHSNERGECVHVPS